MWLAEEAEALSRRDCSLPPPDHMAPLLQPSSVQHVCASRALALVAVCLLLLSGGCDAAARRLRQAGQQTPWQYIHSTPGLEILASLVQAANLSSTLDNLHLNFTLLMPNNASFAALESEQGISVAALKNSSVLRTVLLYHVYPAAALRPANLTIGKKLLMGSGHNMSMVQELQVGLYFAFMDEMGRAAALVTSNISLGSSIGYIINRVMLPIRPETISEALSYQTSMSQIYGILRYAAAAEVNMTNKTITNLLYSNKTNVTFLVPTDDAFAAMCVNTSTLFSDMVYLRKMLLTHFLPMSLDFAQLAALNGTTIHTLNPEASFEVAVMYGTVVLYGSNVSSTLIMVPDLVAGSSFLHTINTILLPNGPGKPTFSCPDLPPSVDYNTQGDQYYDYPPSPIDTSMSSPPS